MTTVTITLKPTRRGKRHIPSVSHFKLIPAVLKHCWEFRDKHWASETKDMVFTPLEPTRVVASVPWQSRLAHIVFFLLGIYFRFHLRNTLRGQKGVGQKGGDKNKAA